MSISMDIPVLETERLILRGPEEQDFDDFAALYADAERSWGIGGPLNRAAAWRAFATDYGHWVLRGYGLWTVVEKPSGRQAGRVGFWNPEGWLEREIGWTMFAGFEGKGIAYEAALKARSYAYEVLGWGPLISVIAPGNTRSIALAERLGAGFERNWITPSGKDALIYRHPTLEEVS